MIRLSPWMTSLWLAGSSDAPTETRVEPEGEGWSRAEVEKAPQRDAACVCFLWTALSVNVRFFGVMPARSFPASASGSRRRAALGFPATPS